MRSSASAQFLIARPLARRRDLLSNQILQPFMCYCTGHSNPRVKHSPRKTVRLQPSVGAGGGCGTATEMLENLS